jgi:hypothetical protein
MHMKPFLTVLLLSAMAAAQGVTPAQAVDTVGGDTLSKITLEPRNDSVAKEGGTAPGDSLTKTAPALQNSAVLKKDGIAGKELVNIVSTEKKIRAMGWGEYRVGGHCLCCDNMRSVDCITVQTINRTDRLKIKQIVDGKTAADSGDAAACFGNIYERDAPATPVALLMAEITLPRQRDICRVIVYGVADSQKRKNVTFNCELGYMDQFDRLQWAGKVENSGHEDRIVFDPAKPLFTDHILLKIRDGRNRITEVAIFAEDKKER